MQKISIMKNKQEKHYIQRERNKNSIPSKTNISKRAKCNVTQRKKNSIKKPMKTKRTYNKNTL